MDKFALCFDNEQQSETMKNLFYWTAIQLIQSSATSNTSQILDKLKSHWKFIQMEVSLRNAKYHI